MDRLVKPKGALKQTSNKELLLAEHKHLAAEAQFVMTRYMQAIALYLALTGFAMKEFLATGSYVVVFVLFCALSALNCVGVYSVGQFRTMAYYSLERQALVAEALEFQRPHHMIWGYFAGLSLIIFAQSCVTTLLIIKSTT